MVERRYKIAKIPTPKATTKPKLILLGLACTLTFAAHAADNDKLKQQRQILSTS
jgi:hypothetical protein